MIGDDKLDDRLLELLQAAIAPAPERAADSTPVTSEMIYQTIAELRENKRPTWVVPPGFTVDWSIPVDVVESPWPSDYVYVLPPQRDPWS